MNTPSLLIFDDGLGDFGPLCDLRPCFDLRTGACTTRQRIESRLGIRAAALQVPPALLELVRAWHPELCVNRPAVSGFHLLVNGRITPHAALPAPRSLGEPVICAAPSGHVLWAHLPYDQVLRLLEQGCRIAPAALAGELPGGGIFPAAEVAIRVEDGGQRLLWERPWHVLDTLEATLREDLQGMACQSGWSPPAHVHVMGAHPVRADDCRLQPGVVLNAEAGSIVIEAGAIIGAHSVIEGPCYVGPRTQLAVHTYLRSHTVIGPWCKVAGEISFTIVQGFSNKAHLGYLGHALVGEWVNLGAGTTVSNLKNTYGPVRVRMHPDRSTQETGRTFHGPILGDFVRTAIGSRILTGACFNTGAMIALSQYAPKCAKPFGFYTDDAPHGAAHEPDKFIAVARAMMARRQREMPPALEQRLRVLMG